VVTVGGGIVMMALELPKLVGPKLVGAFCAKDAVDITDRMANVDRAVFIVISVGGLTLEPQPPAPMATGGNANLLLLRRSAYKIIDNCRFYEQDDFPVICQPRGSGPVAPRSIRPG